MTLRIADFLRSIGIAVTWDRVPDDSFLPAILIRNGALIVDGEKLQWPGDLLHEAGHIAVTEPEARATLCALPEDEGGEEMAAIAWSYAAAVAMGIDPAIVFHEAGYRGGSQSLLENFSAGHWVGVPMLQWFGLAWEARNPARGEEPAYPAMRRWLR